MHINSSIGSWLNTSFIADMESKGRPGKFPFKFFSHAADTHCRRLSSAAGSAVLLKGLHSKLPQIPSSHLCEHKCVTFVALCSACQGHETRKGALRLKFEKLTTGRNFRPFYTTEQFLKWFEFKHDIFLKQLVTYPVTALVITPLKLTWILPRACNIHVAKFYYWLHVCMDQRSWNKGKPFDHQFLNW